MPTCNMSTSIALVTPTFPSFRGNGRSMRAAAILSLLSKTSDIHLIVVPLPIACASEPEPEIAAMCKSWRLMRKPSLAAPQECSREWMVDGDCVIPPEWAVCNQQWRKDMTDALQEINPDLVFLFRFYLTPFVAETKFSLWLDLDELESTSRSRLSHVYAQSGRLQEAHRLRLESIAYEQLEKRYLPLYKKIFTASDLELLGVMSRYPAASVAVLPNVYPRIIPQPARAIQSSAKLLYVGTLGYFPNADAVTYFCDDILWRLQDQSPKPVELTVIGSGNKNRYKNFPRVNIIGAVPDTTPF